MPRITLTEEQLRAALDAIGASVSAQRISDESSPLLQAEHALDLELMAREEHDAALAIEPERANCTKDSGKACFCVPCREERKAARRSSGSKRRQQT